MLVYANMHSCISQREIQPFAQDIGFITVYAKVWRLQADSIHLELTADVCVSQSG